MLSGFDSSTGLSSPVEVVSGALRVSSSTAAAGNITETITVVPIVAAATAVVVVAANAARKTLVLMNDAADAWYGYSSGVTASTGMPLPAGGGFAWGLGETDPRAVYVFSTAGTTIRVKQGV